MSVRNVSIGIQSPSGARSREVHATFGREGRIQRDTGSVIEARHLTACSRMTPRTSNTCVRSRCGRSLRQGVRHGQRLIN